MNIEKVYSWKELKEKYHWVIADSKKQAEKIQYAKARGIILEPQEKDLNKIKPRLYYKIAEEFKYYTREELINKYNLQIASSTKDFIRYCKKRGIIIERLGLVNGVSTYKILNDKDFLLTDEIWKKVEGTALEVSNLGRVKNLSGQIKAQREIQGYMYVTDGVNNKHWRVHRLVLIAFNPIDNYEEFDIDHINGIRTDNRVENLRWVSTKKNIELRDLHQNQIGALISELVQKYGYDDIYMYLLDYKKKGE